MYGAQSSWGNLTLLGFERRNLKSKDENGVEYDTGALGPALMILRCRCGHQFEIEKRMFPGRRDMRDCGRDECEYAAGSLRDMEREKEIQAAKQKLIDERQELQRELAEKRLNRLKDETASRRLPGRPLHGKLPGRNVTVYLNSDEYEALLTYAAEAKLPNSRAMGALILVGKQYLEAQKELESQAAIESTIEPQPINQRGKGKKLHFLGEK